jgi:hypothetical protein
LGSALCVFPAQRPKLDCVVYAPKCKPFLSANGPIQFVQGEGKVQAAVVLSAADDEDSSTMTLQLTDVGSNRTVTNSYQFGNGGLVSGEVDLWLGLTRYRLVCQGSRVFDRSEPMVSQLCQ